MRFVFRLLPIIFLILFISLIYFGGKKAVTYVNENGGTLGSKNVTENLDNDYINETFDDDESLADIGKSPNIQGENQKNALRTAADIDDADFEEDFSEEDMDSPEASLEAELEGKSSNQLIASAQKKKETITSKIKEKVAPKSSSAKKRTVKKTNEKPSKDKLTKKGITRDVPASYDRRSRGGQFMVIAGSFSSKENANIFIDDLEKKGLKNIEIIEIKNKNLNRVCVSRHSTYEDAKVVAKRLRKTHNVEAYVHRKTN